ncbi:phage portal protein [Dinoroseobacter sp. S375]|uniref:phage portal protein n=1 Tax=Dinoroseobacter sp. S375 TaxID=3415136 RepID=UPI003C7EBCA5
MFGLGKRAKEPEQRAVVQSASAAEFFAAMGLEQKGIPSVTVESALEIPAVFAAVNFIAGTIAGLPLHVYERTEEGREKVKSPLATLLHDAVSDEMTSFEWRKYVFQQFLTGGRSITQIVRNGRNEVRDLIPWNPLNVTVERREGRKFYIYKDGGAEVRLPAADVIDLPFMLAPDGVSHVGPIAKNREALGVALAVQKYAGLFFANGGVPPYAITGNFQSAGAMKRAADDLEQAVQKAAKEARQALVLPAGLTIEQIGSDPDKTQLLETQRYYVEQVARIYSLPPTFLQDLTHGTHSNTEQQDLHFAKHSLKRHIEQFEQEMNLKLFGRRNSRFFVELSIDGLLRGDFKTRMEGHATAIQAGLETPNEGRAMENRPPKDGGDDLLIQGATVPLGTQQQEAENDDT